MTDQRNPGDPEPGPPPSDEQEEDESPWERPPFERDPEAQHAPGAEQDDPGGAPPPMRAGGAHAVRENPDENLLDAPGIAREPVGNDNIREGRVGGVMGPQHQSMGQGQGG